MELSSELVSQFAKLAKDNKEIKKETIVYGTTVMYNNAMYVKLDGSDRLTPISTTADVKAGERVTVMIKNHTATVTGNMSSPAARTDDVKDVGNKITEVEILVAGKVDTEQLNAQIGRIDTLESDNVTINQKLTANEASIGELSAKNVTIEGKVTAAEAAIDNLAATRITAEIADAKYATIENLQATDVKVNNLSATYGEFKDLTTNKFTAIEGDITSLETNKLSATDADLKYANIDFSNIGKAAIEKFFSESGMIDNLVVGEGTITGKLVGVTINGDLIEGNTVKADKLVVQGSDGLYYKLNIDETGRIERGEEQTDQNSLNGSVILAKSITATQISVSDLVAFGATIGGFTIVDGAIYSGVKESIDNTTSGIYMDNDGQVAIGDGSNFLRYYQDTDGTYKLAISANSVIFSLSGKSVEESLNETNERVGTVQDDMITRTDSIDDDLQQFLTKFAKYITFASDTAITIGSGDNTITLEIDNETGIVFKKNGEQFGWWDGVDFHTGNIVVEVNERAQFGNFAYVPRSDGSLSFLKVSGG